MDSIRINLVEVAGELAHNKLLDILCLNNEDEADEILYDTNDTSMYKEEYQDMFNEYYDYFYTIIDNLKMNN